MNLIFSTDIMCDKGVIYALAHLNQGYFGEDYLCIARYYQSNINALHLGTQTSPSLSLLIIKSHEVDSYG